MKKTIGNILFVTTLISPVAAFSLACALGEPDIFGVFGIVRYSPIMWLFILFGISSVVVAIILKKSGQKWKKNLVISCICIPIIMIFGSYRFIFSDVCYDNSEIIEVSETLSIDLPIKIKSATGKFDSYKLTYAKITDSDEKNTFEEKIKQNATWTDKLKTNIKGLLVYNLELELPNFDYFIFYNLTTSEYNTYPENGQHECIFVAYDQEAERLIVVSDYFVQID